MTKKLFLFLFGILLINCFIIGIHAKDVAYVVKDSSFVNNVFTDTLNELNYSYDIIINSQITSADFSSYKMILVGDSYLSNAASVPVKQKNSLVLTPNYVETWGLANYAGSSSIGNNYLYGKILQVNSVTRGFTSPVQLTNTYSIPFYYLPRLPNRASSYKNLISPTMDSDDADSLIGILNKNSALYGGGYSGGRIGFIGMTNTNYWTTDTRNLFKNMIVWTLNGDDLDGDGYYSDYDCNDTNLSIWNSVGLYRDYDSDGFGSGPLIATCIGNSVPVGYTNISGDCSPSNANLWRNENAYVDSDNDGFGNINLVSVCIGESLVSGYSYTTGDCNDLDLNINPNSTDVFKNCRNDAPIVGDLNKISVYEGENATITVNVTDPENDNLSYSINDSRFDADGNGLSWKTELGDLGEYSFEVSVSDGEFTIMKNVDIEVKKTYLSSVCDIPNMTWSEDENYVLDLNNYCADSYPMTFTVNEIDGIGIQSMSNENGVFDITSKENWNGQGWIVFKIANGFKELITEKVFFNIENVNDAPVFENEIDNITFQENQNLANVLDLKNYFKDIDNNLTYEVNGNDKISINIENGVVSFSPQTDWFGEEEIIFSATDGEYEVNSNSIVLKVNEVDMAPEFGNMNCNSEINEETEASCELNASDNENDNLVFNVVSTNNINCAINGNVLRYSGTKDYYGPASCVIRVSDNGGYDEYLLVVQIGNVNDAPEIKDYFPKDISRLIENINYRFYVLVSDVDSSTNVKWFVNNEQTGTGSTYYFNKTIGTYEIKAVVSDENYSVEKKWNVNVGLVSEFTCSQAGGSVCSEIQVCSQNYLGVYDSQKCCPVSCSKKPIDFKAVKEPSNANKSGNIVLNIKTPEKNQRVYIGNQINTSLEIENNIDSELEMDVDYYLYDLTKDRVISKERTSFTIAKNSKKTITPNITVEQDLNEDNEYALLFRAIGDGNKSRYYNQNYVEINIDRKDYDVIFNNIEISQESGLVCGDYVDLNVDLINLGTSDKSVYLVIGNSELGITEKTDSFNVAEYDSDEKVNRKFSLKIPENAKAGDYKLTLTLFTGYSNVIQEKTITLNECDILTTTEIKTTEPIKIGELAESSISTEPIINEGNKTLFLILNVSSICLFAIILFGLFAYKKKLYH